MGCTTFSVSPFLPPIAGGLLQQQQQHRRKRGASIRYGTLSQQQFPFSLSHRGETCSRNPFPPSLRRVSRPSSIARQLPGQLTRSHSSCLLFLAPVAAFVALSVVSQQLFFQAAGQPLQDMGRQLVPYQTDGASARETGLQVVSDTTKVPRTERSKKNEDEEAGTKLYSFSVAAKYIPPASNRDPAAAAATCMLQQQPPKFDPTKREVRHLVQLRASVHQEASTFVGEIIMMQQGEVLGGFRAMLTNREQVELLQKLVALSENPNIYFQVEWEGRQDRTGQLYIRAVLPLYASAFKPSVLFTFKYRHVRDDGAEEEIPLHAEVPIDEIMKPGQDIGGLKGLIVQYSDVPGLLTGPGAFMIDRLYETKEPKNAETRELAMVHWLLHLLQGGKSLDVSGELLRNLEIRSVLPETPQPTWKDILNIQLGLEEAARRGHPVSQFQKEQPGLRLTELYIPEDGLRNAAKLGGDQPSRLRDIYERTGHEGVSPLEVINRYRLLFGPHYDSASNPLLFLGPDGDPIYSMPGFQQYFIGPGATDPRQVPDHLDGFLMPAIKATFRFPDGQHFFEFVNPARPWASFEEGWKPLAAKHKLKYSFREPGLRTVTINGAEYALDPEFLEHYPTLLHLLARLSESDPSFTLDSVSFNFGDKLPKQIATLFVIENYQDEGVPWCSFEFVIPLSAKGSVDLRGVMKKAAAAASSPKGCNLHERGFHFEELHRWGYVDQRRPLLISWKQTLNMRGDNKAEGHTFGQILKQAHLSGKQVVISFHAKHKVTAVPVIEQFGPDGKIVKVKKQRPVTTVVGFGDDLDGVLYDFQQPFKKRHVPMLLYPFMPAGKVKPREPPPRASDALDEERLGPTYYHRPKKVKIEMKPELPLLHSYDRFVDGTGGHPNLKPLNIPLAPGSQQFTLPISSLRQWLNRNFPAASLPVNLNRMSNADLEGLADHLYFKMKDGSRQPLRTIFVPQLFSPDWDSTQPGAYKHIQDFLKQPKDIMLGKNFRFVVTQPDGSQRPIDVTVEPGTMWRKVLEDFFRENPNVAPQQVKLVLLDDQDQPLKQLDIDIDIYTSPYAVAVDQEHLKGLRVSLDGLGAPFSTCYQEDPREKGRCLVVDMRRIFCGEIQPGKLRTRMWNVQCTPTFLATTDLDLVEKEYSPGPDDVRARTIRDLLAAAKAGLKAKRPGLAASVNLPLARPEDDATVMKLTTEREKLLRQSQKTLQQMDRLRQVKLELKQRQRKKQEPWARLKSVTVTKRLAAPQTQGQRSRPGELPQVHQQQDFVIALDPRQFYMNDHLWKVFKAAATARPDLQLHFEDFFEVTFEVLDEKARKAWKLTQQQQQRKKAAEKKVAEKVLVDVTFIDIDGSVMLSDVGVDIKLKVEKLAQLSKGEKSYLIKQLQKLYGIPQAYFVHRREFPKVQTSGSRWSITVLLGLLAGAGGAGLRPFASNPEDFVKQLQQKGGLQLSTLITVVQTNGSVSKIPLSKLASIKPGDIKGLYFPWKKAAGQVQEEKKKAVEEKQAEAAGIYRIFRVAVSRPQDWKPVLQEWLRSLYDLQVLKDSPLVFKIKRENQKDIRCTISTFGHLLQLVNDPQMLLRLCPGFEQVKSAFSFHAEVRGPPSRFFKLYNRMPSEKERERNPRLLRILKTRLLTVPEDGRLTLEYSKQKHPLSREELKKLKLLLQEAKPEEDVDDVVARILQMLGYPDVQIAKPGRLRFILSEEPTSEEQKLVKEGMLLVEMEDLQSGNRPLMAPLTVPENQPLGLDAPAQLYKVYVSVFAQQLQRLNVACSVKSGKEVMAATWGDICSWCDYKLADLPRLGRPMLIFRLVSRSKTQPFEGSQPVTVTLDGRPLVYDLLQPGSAKGETGVPLPVFENMIQRPGPEELGPMWQERLPQPAAAEAPGLQARLHYVQPEPKEWEVFNRVPTAASPPPKSVASFNFFHTDPEAAETGKAYEVPLRWGFNFPAFNQVPTFRPLFEKLLVSVPPAERKHYKVYLEIPKGNGRMYECIGIDLDRFIDMTQHQLAAACGLDPSLLGAPFGVYLMRNTPTYAGGQADFPFTFIDRMQEPHRGTGSWQQPPAAVIGPLLQGAAPSDVIELEFSPDVICTLSQQDLMELKTWAELMQRCGLDFGKEKPASLAIKLLPVFSTPNVKFRVPTTLLQPVLAQHGNVDPGLLFREWPLERIIAQLLSHANRGFVDVELKFQDGSSIPYSTCPDAYKVLPTSQIPGLVQVIVKPAPAPRPAKEGEAPAQPMLYQAGGVPELLKQLHLPPDASYGQFVSRFNQQMQRPEGVSIPGTQLHIGGGRPAEPGVEGRPKSTLRYNIDLITDEQPPPAGGRVAGAAIPGATRPLALGTFPDDVPMSQLLRNLGNPQLLISSKPAPEYLVRGVPTFGGPPFQETYRSLDQPLQALVQWMSKSVGVEPAEILVDFIVDKEMQRAQMSAAQLSGITLGELFRHLGVIDLENSHSVAALPIPAPGVRARGSQPHKLIVNGHEYPGPASSPTDFGSLFGVPQLSREAAARPEVEGPVQDLQVKIRTAPNMPEVVGIVPHDMLPWLQKISDKHGQPGLNLILNFLNQLNSLSELPPGGALSIQTQLIPAPSLQTLYPPGHTPQEGPWVRGGGVYPAAPAGGEKGRTEMEKGGRGPVAGGGRPTPAAAAGAPGGKKGVGLFYTQLRLPKQQQDLLKMPILKLPQNFALTGKAGPAGKDFFIPVLPGQRSMPVAEMLRLFGIQPQALRSIKVVTERPETGSIEVSEGKIHFQPLAGKSFTISLSQISSSDHTPLAELLKKTGHSVEELLGTEVGGKQLALKIRLKHGPQKQTKITTPVGTRDHLYTFLAGLTLWRILPPLIDVTHVEQVWLRIVVAKEYEEESDTTSSATTEAAETQSDTGSRTSPAGPADSEASEKGTSPPRPSASTAPTSEAGAKPAVSPPVTTPPPVVPRNEAPATPAASAAAEKKEVKPPVPKPRRASVSGDKPAPPVAPPRGTTSKTQQAKPPSAAENKQPILAAPRAAAAEAVASATGPGAAASGPQQPVASAPGAAKAPEGPVAKQREAPRPSRVPPKPARHPVTVGVARYSPEPLTVSELSGYRLKDTHELFLELSKSRARHKFGDSVGSGPLIKMLVKQALTALVSTPTEWHRCFWGEVSAENSYCIPKLEFTYQHWVEKHFGEVHIPIGLNCLLIKEIKNFRAARRPNFFPLPYLYHEAVLEVQVEGEPQSWVFFEEEVPPELMAVPVSTFLEQQGFDVAKAEARRCPVMTVGRTLVCKTKYAATLSQETLRSAAVVPAFIRVSLPRKLPTSFLQVFRRRRLPMAKRHFSS